MPEPVEPAELATDGPTPSRRRRRWPLVTGVTVAALALAGVGAAYGQMHKTVTLDVDGAQQTVSTTASDVGGLLEAQGIVVDDRDTVAPGADAALEEGSDVVVRSGKELTVDVDGKQRDAWVTALDADEALDGLAARGDDVNIVASRSGDRASLPLDVDTDGSVAVVADGKTKLVQDAADVDEVLSEADVELDKDDTVHVTDAASDDVKKDVTQATKKAEEKAADQGSATQVQNVADAASDEAGDEGSDAQAEDAVTKPQVAVVVERVETKKVTKTSAIDHDTKTETSDDRYADLDPKVAQEGKDGERTRVYQVTTVDGDVVKKKKVSDEVTAKPRTEVLVEGTKERPEPKPEPQPASSGSSGSSGSSYSGSPRAIGQQMAAERGWSGSEWTCLESLWDKESGWSLTATNPSSGAYGIPQALPGSKMATAGSDWQSNPATQIEWGLGYIADRYGTPCGAWGHSQSVGWY